jgi:MFS family permease
VDRRAELRSALNAGAIAAVVSLIPLAFFLAAPLAGYFGVRFYQRRGGMPLPSAGAGFRFGALVGLFASPIFAVLRVAQVVASGEQGELRKAMIEKLQQAAANSPDPQAHQLANYFASRQGMAILMIFGLVFICLAFVLLAGLGGAISASLRRRKNP